MLYEVITIRICSHYGYQDMVQGGKEHSGVLVADLLAVAVEHRLDLNRLLRALSDYQDIAPDGCELASRLEICALPPTLSSWLERYRVRAQQEVASAPIRRQQMRAVNPRYLLRNYMVV